MVNDDMRKNSERYSDPTVYNALKKNGAENRNFGQISGHLPGFCPLLNPHFDHEKPSIYAGLRAFCPLSHFFL